MFSFFLVVNENVDPQIGAGLSAAGGEGPSQAEGPWPEPIYDRVAGDEDEDIGLADLLRGALVTYREERAQRPPDAFGTWRTAGASAGDESEGKILFFYYLVDLLSICLILLFIQQLFTHQFKEGKEGKVCKVFKAVF